MSDVTVKMKFPQDSTGYKSRNRVINIRNILFVLRLVYGRLN